MLQSICTPASPYFRDFYPATIALWDFAGNPTSVSRNPVKEFYEDVSQLGNF
jgi:hypothetical protein